MLENIYYVYALIDPRNNKPFYIGEGKGKRAWSHLKFKSGCNNPHKDNVIKKIYSLGLTIKVEILKDNLTKQESIFLEEQIIEGIGLNNLTNIVKNAHPPSRKGWKPSLETLRRRSKGLKGFPRNEEWCQKLSNSKTGSKNPMFGIKNPCSAERRYSIIKTKNLANYDIYKSAIELLNAGTSADKVAQQLKIGRGVCFRLKNRTHSFFEAFPELK